MSIDRGIAPGGILVGSSWTRNFWKSENSDLAIFNSQDALSQFLPMHFLGSVYLNCCNVGFENVPHSLHLKMPMFNYGLTSVVRVIVPLKDMSFPRRSHRSSLTLASSEEALKSPESKVTSYFYSFSSSFLISSALCKFFSVYLTNWVKVELTRF